MGHAKNIIVKPISSSDANRVIRSLHYSGKVVNNSSVHLGVFLDGKCGGALQFGPSLDKRRLIGLVRGTGWNEFTELNRMALADWLPRNSESRAIAVAMRILRKSYPHLKWVVSFADGTQCGDGTIYRATGFVLTSIRKNRTIYEFPDGERMSDIGMKTGHEWQCRRFGRAMIGQDALRLAIRSGAKKTQGFQLRYIYFLDPSHRERLTVPIIPFSEIERQGAGMYRGKSSVTSIDSDATANHAVEGGAIPTVTLCSQDKT